MQLPKETNKTQYIINLYFFRRHRYNLNIYDLNCKNVHNIYQYMKGLRACLDTYASSGICWDSFIFSIIIVIFCYKFIPFYCILTCLFFTLTTADPVYMKQHVSYTKLKKHVVRSSFNARCLMLTFLMKAVVKRLF